jgi:hypothetical protein
LPRYLTLLIRTFVTVAVCSAFARLFFGVDFTDESQYVAEALGPLIGGKAFVTDRFFQQSGSLWATPFFWLYLKIVGSTTGIALCFRILYFFTTLTTGTVLFKALRKSMLFDQALALGVLPVLYIPFAIPGISYNTMAVQMTIMSLALLRLLKHSRASFTAALLSLSFAMAIFSYPTLAVVFIVLLILEFKYVELRALLMKVSGGTAAFLFLFSIPILLIGSEEIERNFSVARAVSLFTPEAKWQVSKQYLEMLMPSSIYVVCIFVGAAILLFRKKPFEFAALPFLAIFYFFLTSSIDLDVDSGFIIYGTAATLFLIGLQKLLEKPLLKLSPEICISLLMGLSMGVTSTNGILNASFGFSITLIFLIEWSYLQKKVFPWLAWASIVIVYIFAPWNFFYRESRLPELSSQIESGPFFGLVTNSLKDTFLKQVEQDLSSLPKAAKSIFIYDSFPAGYLFTNLKPQTFLYYMHPYPLSPGLRPELIRMLSLEENRPDIVMEMIVLPVTAKSGMLIQNKDQNTFSDPFWGFFRNNPGYRVLVQREFYTLYVRNTVQ